MILFRHMNILVLMSTYNGEQYLQEQLDSILKQEIIQVNILIRDDGSNDRTISLIKRNIQSHPNRIFLIQGENLGYARSFTKLLEIAAKKYPDYDYYAFSDQDDVWLPQKLFRAVSKLEEAKIEIPHSPLGYCSNLTSVDSRLHIIREKVRAKIDEINDISILLNPMCTGCTMAFNLKAIQLYVENGHSYLKYHDYLMGIICFFLGKLVYDDESYIYYRQHGGNQIGTKFTFSQRMLTRLHYFKYGESNVIEKICKEFISTYRESLSDEQLRNISKIAYYRKGMNRWKLILSAARTMKSFEMSLFLICKILFGKL